MNERATGEAAGPAGGDGVITAEVCAAKIVDAMQEGRFLVRRTPVPAASSEPPCLL